jgi:hypothetical protein
VGPQQLPSVQEASVLSGQPIPSRLQPAGGGGSGGTPASRRPGRRIMPMRMEPLPGGAAVAPSRLRSSPLPPMAAFEGTGGRAAGAAAPPGAGPRTPLSAATAARLSSRMCSSPLPLMPAAEAAASPAAPAAGLTPKRSLPQPRSPSPAAAAPPLAGQGRPAAAKPQPVRPTALESAFAAVSLGTPMQSPPPPLSPPPRAAAASPRCGGADAAEPLAAALLRDSDGAAAALAACAPGAGGSSGSNSGPACADAAADAAVVAALSQAAQRCADALAAGSAAVADVEERLLRLLAQTQASEGEACALQERAMLLCGALLHAWLCSPAHERAVWSFNGGCDGAAGDDADAAPLPPALQSFRQLPSALMKVVRRGCSLGVLRQLRLWLQDATLGGPRVGDGVACE